MAIIRKREIKSMDLVQIETKIKELSTDLGKMKSQVRSGGAPENSGKMGQLRKTIARLETFKLQRIRAGETLPAEKLIKSKTPEKMVVATKSKTKDAKQSDFGRGVKQVASMAAKNKSITGKNKHPGEPRISKNSERTPKVTKSEDKKKTKESN